MWCCLSPFWALHSTSRVLAHTSLGVRNHCLGCLCTSLKNIYNKLRQKCTLESSFEMSIALSSSC